MQLQVPDDDECGSCHCVPHIQPEGGVGGGGGYNVEWIMKSGWGLMTQMGGVEICIHL